MTKAEILQKYLPCHTTYGDFDLCVECPYNPNHGKIWEYGCAHGQDKMIDDAITLLKEQEAVRPEREHSGGGTTWWNVCGNCRTAINPNDKFCHECGKAVKWDG